MTGETPPAGEGAPIACFVIGPIGDKFADVGTSERDIYEEAAKVLEEVIEPACGAFGIKPIRADAISQPGEIPDQAFSLLRDVDLVIADLTDANPNVMYELGLRHTRNKCTIQLGERARLPFDVSAIRTIQFKRSVAGLAEAREELKRALADCLAQSFRPVTATRLWLELDSPDRAPSRQGIQHSDQQDNASEDEAPGFVELLAEMEAAIPNLGILIREAGAITESIGAVFVDAQGQIEAADAKGKQPAAARVRIAGAVANELVEPAERLQDIADEYEAAFAAADSGMSYMISEVKEDPNRLEELGDLPASVATATAQVNEAMNIAETLANQMAILGRATRALRQPTQKIAAALRRIAAASAAMQTWDARLRRLSNAQATSE